jgi:hypothetical protein
VDTLKLARDGHLWVARYADNRWVRPVYDVLTVLPNGERHVTFPQGGTVVYAGRTTEDIAGPPLVVDYRP